MARQREVFMSGALKKAVPERAASDLFDLMEKFAGYGFNKSHSVAYALIAYQTAWLKAHYPAHFMAAVLSSEMKLTDKIMSLVAECREMGLTVLPPSINSGRFRFTVDASGRIVYGLGAIRNLGQGQIDNMVKERGKGAFTSLFDLCRRTTDQHVNQRAFEILIDSGACDELAEGTAGAARGQLRQCLPEVLRAAEQHLQDQAIGIANLFEGMGDEPGAEAGMPAAPGNQTRDTREILDAERECLGFYLSAHPIDEYLPELANFAPTRLSEVKSSRKNQLLAGMLAEVRVRKRDDGANMGILALDDGSARLEAVMYDPEFKRIQDRLEKYQILIVEGRVVDDDYTGGLRIRAKEVMTLDQAPGKACQLAFAELARAGTVK